MAYFNLDCKMMMMMMMMMMSRDGGDGEVDSRRG